MPTHRMHRRTGALSPAIPDPSRNLMRYSRQKPGIRLMFWKGRDFQEAREIQWDYKNLVRRKGRLERLR